MSHWELLSGQCLQVDDVIPILSPAVYCGFGRYVSQRFAWWHYLGIQSTTLLCDIMCICVL